jgi:WD40 repeat protein
MSWIYGPFLAAACSVLSVRAATAGDLPSPDIAKKTAVDQETGVDLNGDSLPPFSVARLGTVRWRFDNLFLRVAFSADRKVVLSTGNGVLCLWDASTGSPVSWFRKDGRYLAAVLSTDGTELITLRAETSDRGRERAKYLVQHWEVGTGRPLREKQVELPASITVVENSPDGKILIATFEDEDKKQRILDVVSGKTLLEVERGLSRSTSSFSLSGDGKTIAFVAPEGNLYVHETASGKVLHEFHMEENASRVQGFVFPAISPDGKTLVASTSTSLWVWDLASGKLRRVIEECRGRVAFSPDSKYLATGERDFIRLWEVDSLKEVRKLDHQLDNFVTLAFSADGRQLASGHRNSLLLWDVAKGKQVNRFPGHRGDVYCLSFTADGAGLASGGSDGTAIVWDVRTHKPKHEFTGHYLAAVCLAFSPDGKILATGDGQIEGKDAREAQIRLWDLENGRLQRQFTGHLNGVISLAFSPDGKVLASGGCDARARVWDPTNGKRLYQIRGSEGRSLVAFSRDSEMLLIGNSIGETALWNARTGEKLRGLGSNAIDAVFLNDGKTVVTQECDSRFPSLLRFLDSGNGQEARSLKLGGTIGFFGHAISQDGSLIATAGQGIAPPTIQLRDATSGTLLTSLRGHTESINAFAFSPDGKTLASGSSDCTILLWDVTQVRLIGAWYLLGTDKDGAAQATKAMTANPDVAIPFLRDRLRQAAEKEASYARLIADLGDVEFEIRNKATHKLEDAGSKAEFALRLAATAHPSNEVHKRMMEILDKLTAAREEQILRLLADLEGEKYNAAMGQIQAMGSAAETILRGLLAKPSPNQPRSDGTRDERRTRMFVEQALLKIKEPSNASLPLNADSAFRSLAVLEQIATPASRQVLEELTKGPAEGVLTREAKATLDRLDKRNKSPGQK